ncbi:MAG: response regulator transcription factor [Sedimentisphaerales bacterium]|nr:response regulator transcription factor [Sedimentisphaerales bacterium]
MTDSKIVLVDDEDAILELLTYNFSRQGYEVFCAETGREALRLIDSRKPEIIILDLMLPDIDGLEICKQLKRNPRTEQIPIVMLTAKGEEADIVTGLELGADDYVTKPFSFKVLASRVRNILNRRKNYANVEGDEIQIYDLTINPSRHEVLLAGKPINLTHTEFRILQMLTRRPGLVFTRYQIVDAIHGSEYAVTDRTIDVQVASIRKKLKSYSRYIETVRNVGYRFKDASR